MAKIMTAKAQTRVHPTAIVSKEAELAEGVEVGPYSLVGPQVRIGRDTKLAGHVVIEGQTHIGERCRLFTGVCIGTPAQTRKSEVVHSTCVIGDDNIFREYVTVNAPMSAGSKTILGDRNTLMINAHVAHDCVLGSDIVLANAVALKRQAMREGMKTLREIAVKKMLNGETTFEEVMLVTQEDVQREAP
jgi:UDP-N-acetylglucosamine acyltransferase